MRFWGVRGSIPAPGEKTAKFGGNTPCVEMLCGAERLIFDMGTGARVLGAAAGAPFDATIFLSHYHYDHLQGLPFFEPFFDARNRFVLYGPVNGGERLEEVLADQMREPFFPVRAADVFKAHLTYRDLTPGASVRIGEVDVATLPLPHPGGNLGYRVTYGGKSVVYATDVEHAVDIDEAFLRFAHGADVLICDAMYTEDEYRDAKVGWGHSSWERTARAAELAGVKQLVLFHHEPGRSDAELTKLLRKVRKVRREAIAAHERLTLEL